MIEKKPKSIILPLEDLIPKILEGEHLMLLENLKKHPKEYNEVEEEALKFANDESILEPFGKKFNMKYDDLTEEDFNRIMAGVMYQKGYVFTK